MESWFNKLYTVSIQWNYYGVVKKNESILFMKIQVTKTINEKDAEQNGKTSHVGKNMGRGTEVNKYMYYLQTAYLTTT